MRHGTDPQPWGFEGRLNARVHGAAAYLPARPPKTFFTPIKKAARGRLFDQMARNYLAAEAAEAAPLAASTAEEAASEAADAAELAADAAELASEAAEVAAEAAGIVAAGTGVDAVGAGASVLPQAARAAAATTAARTRDLFIFNILDELRKQFSKDVEIVKRKPELRFRSCLTDGKAPGAFYLDLNYMLPASA